MKHVVALGALLVAAALASGASSEKRQQLRVGFVTFAGVVPTTRTLEGLSFSGFLRAEKRLGIQGRVVYVAPTQDPADALARLARQDYDLVISAIPFAKPVGTVAPKFRHVRFLMLDAPGQPLPRGSNIQRAVFRAEEAGYLAGYLAALMESRRGGKHVISAVGGIPFAGVTRWIVGYRAGAKKADPEMTVRIDYSQDFANPAKCRRVAMAQIARGSGVVFNVAGSCGIGALNAAKDEGVWGVGVDIDQSFLGRYILTSAVMSLDKAVVEMVRKLVRGGFPTGGNTVFNLRNGGVGLGRTSGKVPRPFLRRLESIRRQIAAGTIKVPRP